MIIMYILFPVTLLGGIVASPALLFLVPLFVAIGLLFLRTRAAVVHYRAARKSGVCVVFRLWLFFCLPLIMLMMVGILGATGNYSGAVVCLLMTMLAATPVLYAMRPTWAIFGATIFTFTIAGLFAINSYISGSVKYLSVGMALLLVASYIIRRFRLGLFNLWGVQLRIRVPKKTDAIVISPPPEPSVAGDSMDNGDLESASKAEFSAVS
jgi:hypothetical protein